MTDYILNPCDQFVSVLKHDVKQNNGYCTETDERSKKTKCPKRCTKNPELCTCGMYIKKDIQE